MASREASEADDSNFDLTTDPLNVLMVKMIVHCLEENPFYIDDIHLNHQTYLLVPPIINQRDRLFKLGF